MLGQSNPILGVLLGLYHPILGVLLGLYHPILGVILGFMEPKVCFGTSYFIKLHFFDGQKIARCLFHLSLVKKK